MGEINSFDILDLPDEETYVEQDLRSEMALKTAPKPQQQQQPQQKQPQSETLHNGLVCGVCGEPQYTTTSGVTCSNGHGGALGETKEQYLMDKNQRQQQQTQPPSNNTEDSFSPESFFNIGNARKEMDNPFSSENLEEIEKALTQQPTAEAQHVELVERNEVAQEFELPTTVTANNEPFEVINEPNNTSVEIPLTEDKPLIVDDKAEEFLLEGIASNASETSADDIVNQLNGGITQATLVVEEDDADDFIILDEPEDKEEQFIIQQTDQYMPTAPPEQTYHQPPQQHYTQPQHDLPAPSVNDGPSPKDNHYSEVMQDRPEQLIDNGLTSYRTSNGIKTRITGKRDTTNDGRIYLKHSEFTDKMETKGLALIQKVRKLENKGGGYRFEWTLRDIDGSTITATQFNLSPEITQEDVDTAVGKVAEVTGKWTLYLNNKNITVNNVSVTQEDASLFENEVMMNTMLAWYDFLIEEIQSDEINYLVKHIMEGHGVLKMIKKAPAAYGHHDAGPSGLFYHKVKVAMNAYQLAKLYPTVNNDIVIASALLHDIGKLFEMGKTQFTQRGELVGHIVIGYEMVKNAIGEVRDRDITITTNEEDNILHCILSHHTNLEWGSPVTPKTREAVILAMSDGLDAKLTAIDEILTSSKREYSYTFKSSVLDLNN